jgi:hydrogenase maturation protease
MRPGVSDATYLADPSIRQDAYETGRPSADAACRVGDARFFPGEG